MTLKGPGDFSPPDDPLPTLYRCGSCGDEFTSDDQQVSDECPTCGEHDISEVQDEPDYDLPDDDLDDAVCWGGRDCP